MIRKNDVAHWLKTSGNYKSGGISGTRIPYKIDCYNVILNYLINK